MSLSVKGACLFPLLASKTQKGNTLKSTGALSPREPYGVAYKASRDSLGPGILGAKNNLAYRNICRNYRNFKGVSIASD